VRAIAKHFTRSQKYLFVIVFAVYVGAGSFGAVYAMSQAPSHMSIIGERGLYEELRQHASPGDKVVLPVFHTFTTAYFFMPELSYNQGMDPTFSLVASSSAFWLLHHAVMHPDTICPEPTCSDTANAIDIYTVVHNTYGARFIILDYSTVHATATDQFPKYVVPLLDVINHFTSEGNINADNVQMNPYEAFSNQLLGDERFRVLYDTTVLNHRFLLWEIR
jgi:hypothetical protein